jgi:hypothetical protein
MGCAIINKLKLKINLYSILSKSERARSTGIINRERELS